MHLAGLLTKDGQDEVAVEHSHHNRTPADEACAVSRALLKHRPKDEGDEVHEGVGDGVEGGHDEAEGRVGCRDHESLQERDAADDKSRERRNCRWRQDIVHPAQQDSANSAHPAIPKPPASTLWYHRRGAGSLLPPLITDAVCLHILGARQDCNAQKELA